MITLQLFSFLIALAFFGVFSYLGNLIMEDFFLSSSFIYESEKQYIENLQKYVKENHISATDSSSLGEWAHDNRIQHFTISRERNLLYDSSYSDAIVLNQTEEESLHYNWQYFHSVEFADGQADVYIYANYEFKFYLIFYAILSALSVIMWLAIVSAGIHHEVKYIQLLSKGVTQIEQGSLETKLPPAREDELGTLAHGLDQMRLSLIEKERNEAKLKAAQDKLVVGMAHDIRTPLTGLITYLEIAKKQKFLENSLIYIDKAYTKTLQIRDLSDRFFEFFLINSEQPLKLETPEDAEYVLGEYLSELYGFLQADGYTLEIDELVWKPAKIKVCLDYTGRIIDNLLSNIRKYADPSTPIKISTLYINHYIGIKIKNKIAKPNRYHGSGIGTKNINTMMQQMNGLCEIKINSDYYCIILYFPVITS